jgi:hypothetical protein
LTVNEAARIEISKTCPPGRFRCDGREQPVKIRPNGRIRQIAAASLYRAFGAYIEPFAAWFDREPGAKMLGGGSA